MIDKNLFKHFKAIGDIKTAISGAENLEKAIRECVHIIREVSKSESAIIWYYEKDGDGKLHAVYAQGARTYIDHTISSTLNSFNNFSFSSYILIKYIHY